MMRMLLSRLALIALATAFGLTACDRSPVAPANGDQVLLHAGHADGDPTLHVEDHRLLAAVRRATAHYHRVEVALADGYIPTGPCVSAPPGGMGIHYTNFALAQNADIDPLRPEALLYEPGPNGKHRLVGVEYMVVKAAWDAQHATPPSFGSRVFDAVPAGVVPGLPEHYSLHVWLWRQNPLGLFAPFNPKVSCG